MNPNVPQGTLNRLLGSVVLDNNTSLNVTAPFLGEEGINLSFEGEATGVIPTMTGTAMSPAPFLLAVCEIELLKTQAFSNLWVQQLRTNSVIGDFTVIPDSTQLGNFPIINGSIRNIGPGRLNGKNVGLVLTLSGYWQINSTLYTG